MPRWKLAFVIVAAALMALTTMAPYAAPLPQADLYFITSPGSGATISGVVEIIGSVNHPNFAAYGVFYAPGPTPAGDSQWQRITFQQTPVENGVLAVWDTTALGADGQPVVPNGAYTLALARYQQGSSGPDEPLYFVINLTVNNVPATATPTPQEEETPPPTSSAETPTPIPIEQPPTVTPAPTPTRQPGATPAAGAGEEAGDGSFQLDVGRLRNAFLDGARLTILLFILWGLYVLTKAIVRYLLHHRGFHFELPWRKR